MSKFLRSRFTIAPTSRISGLCHSIIRGEPYTSCQLACTYCYARWYRGPPRTPKPIYGLKRMIADIARSQEILGCKLPVRVATLSDPFQPVEKRYRRSLRLLKLAQKFEVPIVLNTRVQPPTREHWRLLTDLASTGLLILQVTVTGRPIQDSQLRIWEPLSPTNKERLNLIRKASGQGIPVLARIQPIIPGLTDKDPEGLIEDVSTAGVRGVIIEFLRIEKELVSKLNLPREAGWTSYSLLGDNLLHPSLEYRLKIAERFMKKAVEERLIFQTCKEGLFHLHTPPDMDCCGFTLFGSRVGRRPHLWDVYRLVKNRGPLAIGEVFDLICEGNQYYLCRDRLEVLPSWLRRAYMLHERRLERIVLRPDLLGMLAPVLMLRGDRIVLRTGLTGS